MDKYETIANNILLVIDEQYKLSKKTGIEPELNVRILHGFLPGTTIPQIIIGVGMLLIEGELFEFRSSRGTMALRPRTQQILKLLTNGDLNWHLDSRLF